MKLDAKLEGLDYPDRRRFVSGIDLVAQRVRLRLATHKGEILRDASVGLPWVEWLSTKPVPLASVRSGVRRQVALVAGVTSVTNVQASASGGTLSVSLDVTSDEGTVSIQASITDEGTRTMSFTANFWGRAGSVLA